MGQSVSHRNLAAGTGHAEIKNGLMRLIAIVGSGERKHQGEARE
jgi:hypothetical protein